MAHGQARRRASGSRPTSAASRRASCKKVGAARGTRHDDHVPPRPARSSASRQFDPETIRDRLEAKATCTTASSIVFRDEAAGDEARRSSTPGGIADFLTKLVTERGKPPTAPQVVLLRAHGREGVPHRGGAAVDRVARRDDPVVRQRHPDHAGRHARAGLPGRRSSRRCAPSSTTTNLAPKGVTLTAEDIREGVVGDAVDLHARAAVPGPDQGAAQQPRGAGAGRRRGAPRARELPAREPAPRARRSSRASSLAARRARRRARPRRRCRARRRSRTG